MCASVCVLVCVCVFKCVFKCVCNILYTYMYVRMHREVFKARDRKTNRIVALKKVRMENEKEGVSLS